MANETPNHQYREVTDNFVDIHRDNSGCTWFVSGCMFVISLPLFILTIIGFIFDWPVMQWIFLSISLLLILIALQGRFTSCKSPNKFENNFENNMDRPSLRLHEAQRAKNFLGFDFGDEFILRTTDSHDYAEILLDFKENEFEPLRYFCEATQETFNRKDAEHEIIITEIKKYITIDKGCDYIGKSIIKPGFTKIERFYDPKLSNEESLWITSQLTLEVDFEARTLKMFFTGW